MYLLRFFFQVHYRYLTAWARLKFRKDNRPALNRNRRRPAMGPPLGFRYALSPPLARGPAPFPGEVVERFKAPVLKTGDGQPSEGSNPSLSAK